MNSHILFEGRALQKNQIGKVWRDGCCLFGFYENKSLLLGKFEDEVWAEFILRKFLLPQLGRV